MRHSLAPTIQAAGLLIQDPSRFRPDGFAFVPSGRAVNPNSTRAVRFSAAGAILRSAGVVGDPMDARQTNSTPFLIAMRCLACLEIANMRERRAPWTFATAVELDHAETLHLMRKAYRIARGVDVSERESA